MASANDLSYGGLANGVPIAGGGGYVTPGSQNAITQILSAAQQPAGGIGPNGTYSPVDLTNLFGGNPAQGVGAAQTLDPYSLQGQAQNLGYQGLLAQLANQLQLGNLMGNYGLMNTEAQTAAPNTIAKGLAGTLFPGISSFLTQMPGALSGLFGGGSGGAGGLPTGMSSNSGAGFTFGGAGASPTAAQQLAASGQAAGMGGASGGMGGGGGLPLAGSLTGAQMGFSPTEAAMVPGGALFAGSSNTMPSFGYGVAPGYQNPMATNSPFHATMGPTQGPTGTSNLTSLLSNMGLA